MPLTADEIAQPYCYLTTTGRVTGKPHTIEIWFVHERRLDGDRLYLMAGGRDGSDWVRNLRRQPAVSVRLGERTFGARARVIEQPGEEDAAARVRLFAKYSPGHEGDLTDWRDSALPVALDLEPGAPA